MNTIKDFISLMYSLLDKWKRIRDISLRFCISDGKIKGDNAEDNGVYGVASTSWVISEVKIEYIDISGTSWRGNDASYWDLCK